MKELKERIKYVRKSLFKGSQAKFALELGVNEARVKSIENNRVKELSAVEAVRIVNNFNLSPDWLLYGKGEMLDSALQLVSSESTLSIQKLTCKASAGAGNDISNIDVFDSGEVLHVDKSFFKVTPTKTVRAVQVDGYSMIPMLFPDSWVIFENGGKWSGDGLYVLNWRGELMVKLLQVDPRGMLHIISANKDYQSWEADMEEDQSVFYIIGKVIRSVI